MDVSPRATLLYPSLVLVLVAGFPAENVNALKTVARQPLQLLELLYCVRPIQAAYYYDMK